MLQQDPCQWMPTAKKCLPSTCACLEALCSQCQRLPVIVECRSRDENNSKVCILPKPEKNPDMEKIGQTGEVKIKLCRHCPSCQRTRSPKQSGTHWRNVQKLTTWCVMEYWTACLGQFWLLPIPDELRVSRMGIIFLTSAHWHLALSPRAQTDPSHTHLCSKVQAQQHRGCVGSRTRLQTMSWAAGWGRQLAGVQCVSPSKAGGQRAGCRHSTQHKQPVAVGNLSSKWIGNESLEEGVGFSSSSCCLLFGLLRASFRHFRNEDVCLCPQAEVKEKCRNYIFSHFLKSRH